MTTLTPDTFLGTWLLIPELSLYAAGEPPLAGTYKIAEPEPGVLLLHVSWRMTGDASERSIEFSGRADGTPVPLAQTPGGPSSFKLTRIDARTLDSTALRGDEVLAYARRVVAEDGTLMAVVQENVTAAGQRERNFQLYRRVAQG